MPCKDSSSQIVLTLDGGERVVDASFGKITCGKVIGGEMAYLRLCRGRTIEDILGIDFPTAAARLDIRGEEEQFYLYLQWDAVRNALLQYTGSAGADEERCQIASVDHEEGRTVIRQTIKPPDGMPKILPCSIADRGRIASV